MLKQLRFLISVKMLHDSPYFTYFVKGYRLCICHYGEPMVELQCIICHMGLDYTALLVT